MCLCIHTQVARILLAFSLPVLKSSIFRCWTSSSCPSTSAFRRPPPHTHTFSLIVLTKFTANYSAEEERLVPQFPVLFISSYSYHLPLLGYLWGGDPDDVNPSSGSSRRKKMASFAASLLVLFLFSSFFPFFLVFRLSQGDRMHWSPTVPPP